RQPALEQAAFGVVLHERQRPAVGVASLGRAPEAAQQLCSRRVEVAVVLERLAREAVDDLEPDRGPLVLGQRDRSAQLDDRRVRQAAELAVEGGDLGPVTRLLGMQGRDCGLDDVRTATVERERVVEY